MVREEVAHAGSGYWNLRSVEDIRSAEVYYRQEGELRMKFKKGNTEK